MSDALHIVQISTHDVAGGAEKVAFDLFYSYRQLGYTSKLVVGFKHTEDIDIIQLPNNDFRNPIAKYWLSNNNMLKPLYGKIPAARQINTLMSILSEPDRLISRNLGYEDFNYPGTKSIQNLVGKSPDVIHCHNLHGDYFDIRVIPELSQQAPFIMTLHDAWTLSGHCAHSFECERWRTGCGQCPDLAIPPAIKRDGTRHNWELKKKIYSKSRLYVTTPSKWLMEKVNQSILAPGIIESRVIPNGVNTNVFYPGDKLNAKKELGLPPDKKILLFAANGIRANVWKDYKTMRAAIGQVARSNDNMLFVALGEDARTEKIGPVEIRFIPYQKDPNIVSKYYRAVDIYVHASKADTFPNSVLEAMASGTPVAATAVGGIPEQVIDGKTGYLTPFGDANEMASAIHELLSNDDQRIEMGIASASIARDNFNLELQVKRYIDWYKHIIKIRNH